MQELLDRYNQIHHQNSEISDQDHFVDFLMKHSDFQSKEPDVDLAWKKLNHKVSDKKKSSKWLMVAASVAVIASLSVLYILNFSSSTQFVSTLDEKKAVQFPDGSYGVLNANSSFEFPSRFGDERIVKLSGEGYFDVVKNTKLFIVEIGSNKVHVLGTAFNIEESDAAIALYVERGKVSFQSKSQEEIALPGTKVTFNKATQLMSVENEVKDNTLSWRNGTFDFNDMILQDVLSDLQTYYPFEYQIKSQSLAKCRLTFTVEELSFSEVLSSIESLLQLEISKEENLYTFSGTGCQ